MLPVFTANAVGPVFRCGGDPWPDELQLERADDYERAHPLEPLVTHHRFQHELDAEAPRLVLRLELQHAGSVKADGTIDTAYREEEPDGLPWHMVEPRLQQGGLVKAGAVEEQGGCEGAVSDATVDVGVAEGQHDGGLVGHGGICRRHARREVEPLQRCVLGVDHWWEPNSEGDEEDREDTDADGDGADPAPDLGPGALAVELLLETHGAVSTTLVESCLSMNEGAKVFSGRLDKVFCGRLDQNSGS